MQLVAILASKRARSRISSSNQLTPAETARLRRATRAAILASRRARSSNENPLLLVRNHFRNLRSRSQPAVQRNLPVVSAFGIQEFNSNIHIPDTFAFEAVELNHVDNYVCPHCDVVLWKEERRRRYNCCPEVSYAINPLKDVNPELWETFHSREFHNNQRRYNSLFSFTALAADGMQKRTWTNPSASTPLTMHGRAYHRILTWRKRTI